MPSKEIQELASRYSALLAERETGDAGSVEKIHVDEIASKVAGFYEKVRNVIEYHDAHLLRKSAIERIVRRRIFLKDFSENFAEPLIKELIRSGHLQNDAVPEKKIADIQAIINNLLFLLREMKFGNRAEKELSTNWLIRTFVPAIEEELFPAPENQLLAEAMYGTIYNHLVIKNLVISDEDLRIQLFIAVQRTLFRPDVDQLHYALMKMNYPHWGKLSEEELNELAPRLDSLRKRIRNLLEDPRGPYFLKLVSREKIVFQLIGDLVFNRVPLDETIDLTLHSFYEERHARAARQLHRLAFVSVLSFLISKMIVAVAIEIPLDQYLYHAVSIMTMAINISFPPILMFLIVMSTRLPSEKNATLVERAVHAVIAGEEEKYVLAAPKNRGVFASAILYAAYGAAFVAVLYGLIKGLAFLGFSPASIIIFLLFTSMVIATGVKVQNRANEMNLEKKKATLFSFLLDLVIVPFMAIGKWTISGLSKFNVLVIAFNFLIELPFQLFIEFLENFRGFITNKKEEIG